MNFAQSAVPAAILPVLDGIETAWPRLTFETQQVIAHAIHQYGPAIALASSDINAASVIATFLNELWVVRYSLPIEVRGLLEAGQTDAMLAAALRNVGIGALGPGQRDQVLRRMLAITEFRRYRDPLGLAEQIDRAANANLGRLAREERGQLTALRGVHSQRRDDADQAELYLRTVSALLGDYPPVQRLLAAPGALVWDPGQRTRGATAPAPVGAGDSPTAAGSVTRYANVHFPSVVLAEQEDVPLIVHVAQLYQAAAQAEPDAVRMALHPRPLTVVVRPEGFRVTHAVGGTALAASLLHARQVQVLADRDCEPLVFFLTPQSVGIHRISVDFEQFDRRILTVSFDARVVAEGSRLNDLDHAAVLMAPVVSSAADAAARPPDLELRVQLSPDRRTLTYLLHAPGSRDYHFRPMGSRVLAADPLTVLEPIFARLSDLARQAVGKRTPAEARAANLQLTALGVELYNQFFTDELKREYSGRLRTRYRGKTLLITTEEPWIPWELLMPQAAAEDRWPAAIDPPLCETFVLSRWVAGRGAATQRDIARGVWIAPPDNLRAARAESDYFGELHRRHWEASLTGPLHSLAQVTDALQDPGLQLFHFACHGNFNAAATNESKLRLGTEFLTPRDVVACKAALRRSRPLVFVNACHSGRVGIGLTQLGGWAQAFLECEASAFIGAQWEVNDTLAALFAQAFYNRLWGLAEFSGRPQPLGQAFHEARLVVKNADPTNPTWLAYVLYGDPHARVTLGA